MTLNEVMSRLQALANDTIRKHNEKSGAGPNQIGVKAGDIRVLAKEIKSDPVLAEELWATGIVDAMQLACLLWKPKLLKVEDLDRLIAGVEYALVADWLGTNVIKQHPQKELRRTAWMDSSHLFTARMGWSLTTERVIKDPSGLDLNAILDRIEAEMGTAPAEVQWTMNFCLGEIGINHSAYRDRAIAIGEKIGAFKDYPVSKGCTSPYVPIWVNAMVSRNA